MAGIFDNLLTLEDTNANTEEPQKNNVPETQPQTNEEGPEAVEKDITKDFYSQEFYDYYKRG